MPVFISYSHRDEEFVNQLAANLVKNKANVWVAGWELNVGDSLIDKIQTAIRDSSALIVVLSKASVASEWCKKELSSGLIRELEERRVVVLPLLLEDCDIPMFLKDKLYADFRTDFDEGLRQTLKAIAKVTSEAQGRIESPEFLTDWSIDWGFTEDEERALRTTLTFVQRDGEHPYTVLTEVNILASSASTKRYNQLAEFGLEWVGRGAIIEALGEFATENELRILLEDSRPKTRSFAILDPRRPLGYQVSICCRLMGEDTGSDVLVDCGKTLLEIRDMTRSRLRDLTREEESRVASLD